ncbi:MAG: 2-C-methyl-D-erythritol 4-phosphate cytidylyltransferase [Chitinophagaceae bacterium]|jgi:2-C-methyl-D-erythritol 4-phosphate cytidylyltransferase|nr:2-C-methyl-D-erythritol 4-phosphate cytidylyltransferase [Chitinophagaceae bacterium]
MNKTAVIVAGGSGQRMNSIMPKQFLLLKGKALLWHTARSFLNAFPDIHLIVVLPAAYLEKGKEVLAGLDAAKITYTAGGSTRFHSVKNGLKLIKEDAIIFVHDAVRCLVSEKLIRRCYLQAKELGSAIPAVSATDTIRFGTKDDSKILDRQMVYIVQTPQTFQSNILLPAFEQDYEDGFTDEAAVVEKTGKKILLITGDYNNLKITRPADLQIAERILELQEEKF